MEDDQSTELIKRAQTGDSRAFGDLVTLHHSNVFGQILRMVRNETDAKDIEQHTWIKVWQKMDTFRFESAFSSWLYRIASFTALDAIRKRNTKRETELGLEWDYEPCLDTTSEVAAPEQIRHIDRKEIQQRFMEALETLAPHHRDALLLREQEGLSYAEIAEKLKCKPGTVMSRIFNARKAIQSKLKDFLP